MTTLAEPNLPSQPAFEPTDQISVADLNPNLTGNSSYILASVALVWPYSSSTRTLALLLADSESRARKPRGQVKVIFHDGSAREVAKTKVGIGDLVRLSLVGCKWQETAETISTPGKKISWDLEFRAQVAAEILRDNAEVTTVNYTAPEGHLAREDDVLETLGNLQDATSARNGGLRHEVSTIHVPLLTPSKSPRRFSGKPFFDTSIDSFADNDGYVMGVGRKRTKFARDSGGWNLVDTDDEAELIPGTPQPKASTTEETSSTTPNAGLPSEISISEGGITGEDPLGGQLQYDTRDHPQIHQLHNEVDDLRRSGSSSSSSDHQSDFQFRSPNRAPKLTPMAPPQTPMRISHLPTSVIANDTTPTETSSDATTTPRLLPLASPGLPLVSPLIQKRSVEIGYFPTLQDGVSQLDASGTSPTEEKRIHRAGSFSSVHEGLSTHSVAHEEHHDSFELPPVSRTAEDNWDGSPVVLDSFLRQQPASKEQIVQPPMNELSNLVPEDQHLDTFTTVSEAADSRYDPAKSASTATELWLSNAGFAIEERRLQQEHELNNYHPESRTPQVIEIEDDDLYGPPRDAGPRTPLTSTEDIPPGQQKSALDVVEEFLQLSPVQPSGTAAAAAASDDKANLSETPSSRRTPEAYIEIERTCTIVEQTSLAAPMVDGSTVQQPELRSSSHSSPHSSSAMHMLNHSMDGNVDERDIFPVPEELTVDHAISNLKLPPTESQHPVISDDVPGRAMTPEEGAKVVAMDEALETASERVEESLPPLQLPNVLPTPEIDFASKALGYMHDDDARLGIQPTSPENSQNKPLVDIEVTVEGQRPVFRRHEDIRAHGADISALEASQDVSLRDVAQESLDTVKGAEIPTQLPTPDHTQPDNLFANAKRIALSPELRATTTAEYQTQDGSMAPSTEGIIPSAQEGTDSGPAVSKTQETLDPPAHRRLSQRLSTRRSAMPANISSPYFTPRRSARTASPISSRKENVRPFTTPVTDLPSSPTQAQHTSKDSLDTLVLSNVDHTITSPEQGPQSSIPRATGVTTQHAYYPSLVSLNEHFNHLVDVIGVCVDDSFQPERAKSGPREYYTSLRLADSSCKQDVVNVRVFRPVKTALPNTRRGDMVLLRDFKAQTSNRKFMLLSTDTSSWAVFCSTEDKTSSRFDVLVTGPPVEYGSTEEDYVALLRSWWRDDGSSLFPPSDTSTDVKPSGTPHSKPRPANRRRTNRTDNIGNENEQFDAHGEADLATPLADKSNHRRRESAAKGACSSPTASTEAVSHRRVGLRRSATPMKEVEDIARTTHFEDEALAEMRTDVNGRRRSIVSSASLSPNVSMREFTPRRSARHKRSITPATEGQGHDGANSGITEIRESSASVGRRGSTVSIASTTPKQASKESAPRRSARHRSPSVVHELRDGTKYTDDGQQRAGSVLHELRDGSTYVDE
ncbi:hypothetical protein RBB50_001802 [Rhinocladiella similis]